jgi:hypothetical protein
MVGSHRIGHADGGRWCAVILPSPAASKKSAGPDRPRLHQSPPAYIRWINPLATRRRCARGTTCGAHRQFVRNGRGGAIEAGGLLRLRTRDDFACSTSQRETERWLKSRLQARKTADAMATLAKKSPRHSVWTSNSSSRPATDQDDPTRSLGA